MAEPKVVQELDSIKKAAIFLLALGKDASAEVIKNLEESQVEKIATEIATLGAVPAELRQKVLKEITTVLHTSETGGAGGVSKAEEFLEMALGKSKASEIVGRVKMRKASGALRKIEQMDSGAVVEFLKGEHPQTIALIIAHLEPQTAASMLAALGEEQRIEVARRVAMMSTISPDAAEEIEEILASQLEGVSKGKETSVMAAGGIKILADILNVADRSTEKEILGAMQDENPEVANQVKQLLFVFDDILKLDDRAVQRILREVDTNDLALALKASDDDIKNKILVNVSERAAEMIQEEIEYMGPKRLSEVEAAQLRIIEVIRNLEEAGEIVIPGRGGGAGDAVV